MSSALPGDGVMMKQVILHPARTVHKTTGCCRNGGLAGLTSMRILFIGDARGEEGNETNVPVTLDCQVEEVCTRY